jgi:hypothetical protein
MYEPEPRPVRCHTWLTDIFFRRVILQLRTRGRFKRGSDLFLWYNPFKPDLLGCLRVLLHHFTVLMLYATAVLFHMLVYCNGVLNTVTIVCSVSVALDHFQSTLLLNSVFLHFVLLEHSLFGNLVLVDHRDIARSLGLKSHKLLAHV